MHEFDVTDYHLSSAGPLSRQMGVYSGSNDGNGEDVQILSAIRSRLPCFRKTVSFYDPSTGNPVYKAVKSRFSRTIRFIRPTVESEMWSLSRRGLSWCVQNPEGNTVGTLQPQTASVTDYARAAVGGATQFELSAVDGTTIAQVMRDGSSTSDWTVSFQRNLNWHSKYLSNITPRLAVLSAAALCSRWR